MRVSKKSQEKTRTNLIEAAVDLMIQKGFEKTTMREIARHAKVGDATIYNYFPTKERIVWAYISLRQEQAIQKLNSVPDFNDLALQEKIHLYFETLLEGYLPDREFLPVAFKMTQQSFLTHHDDVKSLNSPFLDQIRHYLREAIQKQEISDQPIDTLIPHIILDLYFVVLLYWTHDQSDQFNQTTQLIDLLLTILMGVLKHGLISKFTNLGSFLLRHHLFRTLGPILKNDAFHSLRSTLRPFAS